MKKIKLKNIRLRSEVKDRMEGISNIREAIQDLLKEGFSKLDVIKYIKQF